MEYRKSTIKRYRKTWLTKEGYTYLRNQKIKQEKSMTEILDDILNINYKKNG